MPLSSAGVGVELARTSRLCKECHWMFVPIRVVEAQNLAAARLCSGDGVRLGACLQDRRCIPFLVVAPVNVHARSSRVTVAVHHWYLAMYM
eukprot:2449418-Prymnesium_polylepis.1